MHHSLSFFAEIRKEDGDEYEPDIVERRMPDSRSYKARSDTLFTTVIDRCSIFTQWQASQTQVNKIGASTKH